MPSPLLDFRTYKLHDWLSAYRMLAAPLLIYAILSNKKWLFLILAVISLTTDAVDGFIARHRHQTSQRGSQLDSYGDLLTLILMLAGLFRFQLDFLKENSILLSILLGLYFLEVILAVIKYGKPSSFHTYLAKASFVLLGLLYLSLFLVGPVSWLFYTSVILAILSLLEELLILAILPEWRANVKGLYWVLRDKT